MSNHVVSHDAAIAVWTESPVKQPGVWLRLARAIALPFSALIEAIRTRRMLEEISHLSERELVDIGAPPELIARLRGVRRAADPLRDGWR
jgi:uncharacterized protein YjiS (DUF1127 family)